jgi:hypothetical protein
MRTEVKVATSNANESVNAAKVASVEHKETESETAMNMENKEVKQMEYEMGPESARVKAQKIH